MLSDTAKQWLQFNYSGTDEESIGFVNCVARHADRLPEIIENGVETWDEDFPNNPQWAEIARNIRENKDEAVRFVAQVIGLFS